MKIPPADFIPKRIEKLHSDICNKEDELGELYKKIHVAELESMRHKLSLMKTYLKKLKEIDYNITPDDLLHAIYTDIMNDNYKKYFNVIKNTKVDNISELKKE